MESTTLQGSDLANAIDDRISPKDVIMSEGTELTHREQMHSAVETVLSSFQVSWLKEARDIPDDKQFIDHALEEIKHRFST